MIHSKLGQRYGFFLLFLFSAAIYAEFHLVTGGEELFLESGLLATVKAEDLCESGALIPPDGDAGGPGSPSFSFTPIPRIFFRRLQVRESFAPSLAAMQCYLRFIFHSTILYRITSPPLTLTFKQRNRERGALVIACITQLALINLYFRTPRCPTQLLHLL